MAKKEITDTRDNREIILAELDKIGGYQKSAGEYRMIQCPHPEHSLDKTPSCGVYVSLVNVNKLGEFNCFGCGNRGTWNELAGYAGLQEIKEWKNKNIYSADLVDSTLEESLLGESSLTVKGVLKIMGTPEAQPWPESLDWRGFPGAIVRRAGGYIAHDVYNSSVQVVFVVKYAGQVRGGVKAIFEKTKKGQTGYVAMRGAWASKYGLLFFEQTKRLLDNKGYSFVVIVEGPRDALRLLSNGIPAVAVLGAATMTKSKALMLTALGVNRVYVLPDNDDGGDLFGRSAKKFLKPHVPTTVIKLPKKNEAGKKVKIDPGNMSEDLLDDLITLLERKEDFKRRKTLI